MGARSGETNPTTSMANDLDQFDATDAFAEGMLDFDMFFGFDFPEIDSFAALQPAAPIEDAFGILDNFTIFSGLKDDVAAIAVESSATGIDRDDIIRKLEDFFRPENVLQSFTCFFDSWHQNCRTIHKPSFSLHDRKRPLLAAVLLLGALYVPNEAQRALATAVAEYIRLYIFSQPLFTFPASSDAVDDECTFDVLHAGLLIVVARFWAGDSTAKYEASTLLFDRICEVRALACIWSSKFSIEFAITGYSGHGPAFL